LEYAQDVDQAADLARSALAKLEELGLPANPNNFTVWYHYFTNSLPDLTDAVDKLADGDTFSADDCNDLYERFFGNEAEMAAQQEIWEKMKASMAEAVEGLSLTGSEAAQFGDAIMDAASGLDSESNPNDFKKLVEEVVDGARQIQSRTKELEIRLASSTDEVEQLREEMETERREAGMDSLTGIANRKTFDTALRQQAGTAMESGQAFSCFIVYLDFLAEFNKKHGESIGDQALKLVASTLKRKLDETATPARYGGDEFAVILPGADLEAATGIANDICSTLSANAIVNKKNDENLGAIIVSIGVSQYEFGEPLARLISRVDDVLGKAKKDSSNKVGVAERTGVNQNIAFA
tara:strand:+ start:1023 stop:2078 length:1056 start_codon:yes stop_codon:yes gene_type:complete